MAHHAGKLERANVVAGFGRQFDADEALLELRLMRIPDSRIGYYQPAGDGRLVDQLARRHRLAGAVLGGVVGAALGALAALAIARMWYPSGSGPDLNGLMATCVICGALLFGTAGGAAGLRTSPPADAAQVGGAADPFVLAVDAGAARDEVRAVLRRRGGHDLPGPGASPAAGHHAAVQPA